MENMKVVFSNKYVKYAKAVVEEVIKKFKSPLGYKEQIYGKEINKKEIMQIVNDYMTTNDLKVNVFFGQGLVTAMSGNGLSLVPTPGYYREIRLLSLLDHEIGTHHIRSKNNKRLDENIVEEIKKNRIGWQLATEEGLASLCNHIYYTKCNLLYIPAMLYYAVCVAMENSFWDTFKILEKYCASFDECWIQTLRVKRGVADTSQNGAYCKDQATFDGAMRILENRNNIKFEALFAGKVSLETYFLCED